MKIDIEHAYLLAPLAELTHAAFRRLLEEYGAPDLYWTEMLSAAGLVAESPFTSWYLDFSPDPERTVVQLVGGEADRFREAAEKVAARATVYGFDINMGCSVPRIRSRGWGVVLMAEPERARRIVAVLRRSFPDHSLSAKLRLGEREDGRTLCELARSLQAEGLDFLTLHPKTSRTVRSRPAKWSYVGLLRRELRIPVVGNGGIEGPESLERCRRQAGRGGVMDGRGGVMVGRGAVRRPWIFSRLREAEAPERECSGAAPETVKLDRVNLERGDLDKVNLERVGRRHLELIARLLPPEFHVSRARRFFYYFCDNLRFGYRLKMHMQEAPDLETIGRMWEDYFGRNPDEREKQT